MSIEGPRYLVVAGHVLADGSGDYFHNSAAAEILANAFPDWPVALILSVDRMKSEKRAFPLPAHRNIETIIADEEEALEYQQISSKVSQIARSAAAFVNGPYSNCRLIHFDLITCPKFSYAEYGRGNSATGLRPEDYGIVIKELPEGAKPSSLEDPALRDFLSPRSDLCFAYLKADNCLLDRHLQGFILACIAMHQESENNLDIVCPLKMILSKNWSNLAREKGGASSDDPLAIYRSMGFLAHEDFNIGLFASLDIQKLELYQKQEGRLSLVETVQMNERGKTVRLINPFPLSPQDVLLLNSLSSFLGATGDMSVTEAISSFNPFFYQIYEGHKGPFFNSLSQLVLEHFGKDAKITQFFQLMRKFQPETTHGRFDFGCAIDCGSLAKDPEIRVQFRELARLIREKHSFNTYLVKKVDEMLALNQSVPVSGI